MRAYVRPVLMKSFEAWLTVVGYDISGVSFGRPARVRAVSG
jgi:hypothetical protein